MTHNNKDTDSHMMDASASSMSIFGVIEQQLEEELEKEMQEELDKASMGDSLNSMEEIIQQEIQRELDQRLQKQLEQQLDAYFDEKLDADDSHDDLTEQFRTMVEVRERTIRQVATLESVNDAIGRSVANYHNMHGPEPTTPKDSRDDASEQDGKSNLR